MSNLMKEARIQATEEVGRTMLNAAGEVLRRHGNDPHSVTILLAGFSLAVAEITRKIDPKFREQMIRILSR